MRTLDALLEEERMASEPTKTLAPVRVILFGATGMIGGGVLRHLLQRDDVEAVLSVSRRASGFEHAKLTEVLHDDFTDYSALEERFKDYNTCFFALGISSMGLSEAEYTRITYDYAVAAAESMVRVNPAMTFVFISGMGTDETLKSRQMWARVKGKTENKLKTLPFKSVYLFRPAYTHPYPGQKVNTALTIVSPFFPVLKAIFPKYVATVDQMGAALVNAACHGSGLQTLECADIVALAERH